MIKKVAVFFREFSYECKDSYIDSFAASAAFFFFISIIPCCMILLSIVPYTPISQEMIYGMLYEILPENANSLAQYIVFELYNKTPGILSVSIIVFIMSAGRAMLAIMRGFNRIYRIPERKNYFLLRIKSSFYMLLVLFSIVLTLIVMVFSGEIYHLLKDNMPNLGKLSFIARCLRQLILPVFLFFIFMLLYKFVPDRKTNWKTQTGGAFVAAFCWSFFSYFFSIYIEYFHGFSAYGVLAAIIIMLIWLYVMMCVMLFGCEINKYFFERKDF